jgi:predicted XRE-type DNA-binding protein
MKKKKIKFEEGSGNIFADLGLKDSDELFARAQIGFCVYKIVNDQNLKQREIGAVLEAADFFVVGAKQANDVSDAVDGELLPRVEVELPGGTRAEAV